MVGFAWRFFRKHIASVGCILWVAVAAGLQLFCRPIVGLADNKDYWRVTWRAGVACSSSTCPSSYHRYIQLKWQVIPPASSETINYFTSEVPLARFAVWMNGLLRGSRDFDLRVMGACHLALYLLALVVFLRAWNHRRKSQIAVAALAALMFSDVRLVAYFNSFYSESASLIFVICTVGLALWACNRQAGWRGWLVYLALLGSSALFCFAKSQNLAFLSPLAVLTVVLFPPLPGPRWLRILSILPTIALVSTMVWALTSEHGYRASRKTNVAVHLDEELLRHSPDPARDSAELGIVRRDTSKVTFSDIARFYLRHPARWWQMAQRGAEQAFWWTGLGNFESTATTPDRLTSNHFNLWSELKHRWVPRSLPWFIVATVLLGGLGVYRLIAARAPEARRRALVFLALLAGCVGEFIITVTFEANGTAKHLFLFNVVVDLLVLMVIGEPVRSARAQTGGARPRTPAPGLTLLETNGAHVGGGGRVGG
jgi:hypothetical protein